MFKNLKSFILSFSIAISFLFPVSAQQQSVPQPQSEDDSFTFIQITDLHFGIKGNLENTPKIIKAINSLPMEVQFVAVTGDIFHDNMDDEKMVDRAVSIFEKLKIPAYFVPGNHDIHPKTFAEERSIFESKFGPFCVRKEIKNVVMLFIYLESLRKDQDPKNYKPLEVLEENLKQCGSKPVFVFTHSPPVWDFHDNEQHYVWNKDNMEKLIKILTSYNVKALIAGHLHRDEFHWENELPMYICEPVSVQYGRQPAYRIYEYKKGKLGYSTQYLER
jgi:3',5'-cyclic AMP phosphodiesterase CpdA